MPDRAFGEVARGKGAVRYEVIGSIQSRVPVMAASRVVAGVVEVAVRAGDRVRLGQVLVTLDALRSESPGRSSPGRIGRGAGRA